MSIQRSPTVSASAWPVPTISNVHVVIGAEDDPHLPVGALDGVVIVNAYHEMSQGVALLRHLFDALEPDGRLVLCEPIPRTVNQTRAAQMQDHVLDPALIIDDLRAAGFQVLDRQDIFATNLGGTHFGFVMARRPRLAAADTQPVGFALTPVGFAA
jgi:SAM-dependent methyltransferase